MKKPGRILVLLLLALLMPRNAFGRSEFLPGYIIDFHNDTIHGFVKYEKWFTNPDKIAFKISTKRSVAQYKPTDILGFGFSDQIYVGAVVQKEISPFWDSDLTKDPSLHLVSDTVFLKLLIGGERPLLYFKDINEKEHFYIKQDSSYTLLLHKTYVAYEPKRKEFQNMRFLLQLSHYFWDEPTIQADIANVLYTRSSLEGLFKTYLKQRNLNTVFQNQDNKVFSTWAAVAGVSVTRTQIETEYFKAPFGPSTNLTGGISLDLAMAGRLRDWSIYNELLYSSYKSTNTFLNEFLDSPVTFDFQYVRLNTMVRFRPSWYFVNAGISNGYALKGKSSAFPELRKYEIGILAGAGVQYKHYSFELRGEIGDGVSPYVSIITNTFRFQALLSYSF
jgi:hypothetical protein